MVISNTGSLIALAKSGIESARLDKALRGLIKVTPSPSLAPEVKIVTAGLDAGEQQVIALAHEREASLVIIDERLGRAAARRMGLTVTGLVGVLVRAKEARLVTMVRPLLEQVRQRGY